MKRVCYTLFIAFFFFSCASNSINSKKIEEAHAIHRLGDEYNRTGNYTMALKELLEAQKTIPNDPELNNSLGLSYYAKGRYNHAETYFKKALSIKNDYIIAKNHLGATYMKMKRWDSAIALFNEVAEDVLYDTPEIPYTNLGWAYYHQKKYAVAKSYFQKALDIRPNFLWPVHGLASIYIATGYQYQAIDFLYQQLMREPAAAILHSDLAKAYEALKNYDLAIKSWKTVIELEPETSSLAREAEKRLFKLR